MNPSTMYVVQKKTMSFLAQQAKTERVIETLEGPVTARVDDFIMTGVQGEQWPIQAKKFHDMYTISFFSHYDTTVDPQESVLEVETIPSKRFGMVAHREIIIPKSNGESLTADIGDIVVRYGEGDYGAVKSDIFEKTYDVIRPANVHDMIEAADLLDVFNQK